MSSTTYETTKLESLVQQYSILGCEEKKFFVCNVLSVLTGRHVERFIGEGIVQSQTSKPYWIMNPNEEQVPVFN